MSTIIKNFQRRILYDTRSGIDIPYPLHFQLKCPILSSLVASHLIFWLFLHSLYQSLLPLISKTLHYIIHTQLFPLLSYMLARPVYIL